MRGTHVERAPPGCFGIRSSGRGIAPRFRPAGDLLLQQPGEKRHVVLTGIQRGNVVQLTATGITEQFVILYGDFLEGFETVGGEAGADDIEPLEPLGP